METPERRILIYCLRQFENKKLFLHLTRFLYLLVFSYLEVPRELFFQMTIEASFLRVRKVLKSNYQQ